MANINSGFIEGMLGKITPKEKVTFLSICHRHQWLDQKSKQWKEEPMWFTVSCLGYLAKGAQERLQVGTPVIIEFSLGEYKKDEKTSIVTIRAKNFWPIQKREKQSVQQEGVPEDDQNIPF